MKKNIIGIILTTLLSVALVGNASAALIQGSIGLSAGLLSSTGDLDTTLGLDFPNTDPNTSVILFPAPDGDFAGVPATGIIYDFSWPSIDAIVPVTSFLLWEVGDFNFEVTSFVVDQSSAPEDILNISGTGIFSQDNPPGLLESNTGTWNLSANSQGTNFSYSNSNTTNPIPEPATMLLFGTGLVGLAGLGRRKLRKK